MAPIAELGRAYVSVRAETKSFEREVAAQIERIVNKIERNNKINLKVGLDKVAVARTEIEARALGRTLSKLASVSATAGRSVAGLGDSSTRASGGISKLSASLQRLPLSLTKLGPAGFAILAGAMEGAAGGVLILGDVIYKLLGLLGLVPSALAVAAIGLGTLFVALSRLPAVFTALASGDINRFNAELKKLTPEAQGFVGEIQKWIPALGKIRAQAEAAFFGPLRGAVSQFLTNMSSEFSYTAVVVGGAWGRFTKTLLTALSTPQQQANLRRLADATASIIDKLAPGVGAILASLSTMAAAVSPVLELLVQKFGNKLVEWAEKIEQAAADGTLAKWIDDALWIATLLWQMFKEIWGTVQAIGVAIDESGLGDGEAIKALRDVFKFLKDFFESDIGKLAIKGMVTMAFILLGVMLGVAAAFGIVATVIGGIVSAMQYIVSLGERLARILAGLVWGPDKSGGAIANAANAGRAAIGRASLMPRGFAEGGILTKPTFMMGGEDGAEVVIPLTRPDRARQLARESGLMRVLGDSGGTVVNVWIGNEPVERTAMRVTTNALAGVGRSLANGTREAA